MNEYLTQDGERLIYQCRPRKRKTAQLQVHPQEGLIVTVPDYWSVRDVERLIEEKKSWIRKARMNISMHHTHRIQPDLQDGAHFLYQGEWRPLHRSYLVSGDVQLTYDQQGFHLIHRRQDTDKYIKCVSMDWFKRRAQKIFEERVEFFSQQMNVYPSQIKVKEQRKRWGSCTADKKVLFNWRLVFAPEDVMDGVIVHELCHIKQMNHSKDFWKLVRGYLPDYDIGKKWLQNYGHQLFWMDEEKNWRNDHE